MRWQPITTIFGGIALAAALALSSTTAQTSARTEEMVKNARTPEDDLALAAQLRRARSERTKGSGVASGDGKTPQSLVAAQRRQHRRVRLALQQPLHIVRGTSDGVLGDGDAHREQAETAGRKTK